MNSKRIGILDGFRAIAIFSVILFHYFSRWTIPLHTASLYPYNDEFNYFSYGYLGVQFFFMISGFVIFFTLDNTTGFLLFWKKRWIRLFPSMLMASIITFTFLSLFDTNLLFPASHQLRNFLPGLTFSDPALFDLITRSSAGKYNYINGSYWSLWPEIQFYFFISSIYYLHKKHFIRNFSLAVVLLIVLNLLFNLNEKFSFVSMSEKFSFFYTYYFQKIFNLIKYLPFFSIGVMFYQMFKTRSEENKLNFPLKLFTAFLIIFIIIDGGRTPAKLLYAGMITLFFLCVYAPDFLWFFENKFLMKMGMASYFLYLIHENLGIFLIHKVGPIFGSASVLFTLLLITIFLIVSIVFTEKIERQIQFYLKGRMDKKKLASD